MLHEQRELYTKLTGEEANNISIGYLGAYLDGYERGKADMVTMLKEISMEILMLTGEDCDLIYESREIIQKKINALKGEINEQISR